MEITTLTEQRLPALRELIRATAFERPLPLELLRARTLENPSTPPTTCLLAYEGAALIGYCLAGLREGRGVVNLFGVHPAWRRQGVATALFNHLEQYLPPLGIRTITVEGAGSGYYLPGVDLRATEAICFLMKRGYETDRNVRVDMDVDLMSSDWDTCAIAQQLAAEGVQLCQATPADVTAAAAFALQQFGVTWQTEVAASARYDPPLLCVAKAEGAIVSFAAFDATGGFGPTGTRHDFRQRGIGGALLKMTMQAMRARGLATSAIQWVGPLAFYANAVGARISRAYWCFHKNLA